MTYNELKIRFKELLSRRGRGSIKAKDILTLILDLIDKIMGIDVSATATIRKSYNSLAEANADKTLIDPETNKPLKIGQLISVVSDPVIANNAIYRLALISEDGTPTWERQAPLGDMSQYTKSGGSTKTAKDLEDDLDQLVDNVFYREQFFLNQNLYSNTGSYIRKSDGAVVDNENYKSTGFLEIAGDVDLLIYATESLASTPCAFYDKDYSFISSINFNVNDTRTYLIKKKGETTGDVIPTNAKFIRSSCNISTIGGILQGLAFANILDKNISTDDLFIYNGFVNQSNGIFYENENYKSTGFIKYDKNNTLNVLCYKSGSAIGGVYFYDNVGKYIGSLFDGAASIVSGNITPPENTFFIRATAQITQSKAFVNNNTIRTFIESVADLYLEDTTNYNTLNGKKLDIGELFVNDAYIHKDTGEAVANPAYKCTDFLPLDLNNDLKIRVSGSGTVAAAYAFYDKYKQPLYIHFVGSTDIVDTTILKEDFPEGAVYFRGNARPVVLADPHVKNITASAILKMIETKGESDEIGRSLKVMNIGSSHGMDMIQSFPSLAKSAGINIKCANLYTGGIQLSAILDNCINNLDFATYATNENGSSWGKISDGVGTRTVLKALQDERWNIIILQRAAYHTNTWTQSQQDSLFGIIKYITDNVDYSPKILFSMGHPPAVGNESTPTLQDQNQWYLDSVTGALEMQKNVYLDIIPTGTAIQNARSTFLKNYGTGENQDLCRDLLHLDTGIGTYITGCLLFEYIIGKRFDLSILTNKYIPSLSELSGLYGSSSTYTQPTERMAEVARYCVMAAIQNPYEVSENLATKFPAI